MAGEGENPFVKGLFSFPRAPILFPKTFIISDCSLSFQGHTARHSSTVPPPLENEKEKKEENLRGKKNPLL